VQDYLSAAKCKGRGGLSSLYLLLRDHVNFNFDGIHIKDTVRAALLDLGFRIRSPNPRPACAHTTGLLRPRAARIRIPGEVLRAG
jgi:hypothetical protein